MAIDVGKILQDKREDIGISLEEASNSTKIQTGYLSAIENNDRSLVPVAYYDLFLNKYARFLNVELPQIKKGEPKKSSLRKKEQIKELIDKDNQIEHKLIVFIKDVILFIQINRRLSLVIFLFLIVFSLIKITGSIFNTGEKNNVNESVVKIITIEGSSDDKINFDIRDSILIEDDKPEFMLVKISAVDSCYICYYSDTTAVNEKLLLPGEKLVLKGEKIIESKIGNSTAVSISYNDISILPELREQGNGSSMIRITPRNGAEKIKRSEKIMLFLKNNYGLE
ncbi:MAG: helix-turn-helix domain-containing protein [Candidatus Delongbacteria bacterium]|nr:helix-turn-helix domain-containing protein [Candidatus Delongbacteria bacterium]